ncbi:MAG: ORF6N domain-containing protein [Treponema sp.]|nr:ORF6N domain-containing protein [Treponema sp.]
MSNLQNIKSLIYKIRGYQVMLDADLAKIYQVETRILNQAVKRNIDRFPPEFMFRLTQDECDSLRSQFVISKTEYDPLKSQIATSRAEHENLKSQIVTSSYGKAEYDPLRSQFATSKAGKGGRRYLPFAFTEHGVIMLSSVLNSKIANQINISVVKAFIEMRRYIAKPIRKKLDDLEKVLMLHIDDTNLNIEEHAAIINEIINKLNNLIETPPEPKRIIGFHAGP